MAMRRLPPLLPILLAMTSCVDATGRNSATDAGTDSRTDPGTDSGTDPGTDSDTTADTTGYPLQGFYPTTVTEADAEAAYQSWKSSWVSDCPDGSLRVKWDNPEKTVSEGIGYGMLLAASWNDRPTFDGLWSYYQSHQNSNGLMGWLGGCGYSDDPGAATDADLDVAMALIMADCLWPENGYLEKATSLIATIRNLLLKEDGSHIFLCAGDNWGGDCCGNASYQAPAYYRIFAQVTGDSAFWTAAAEDSYYYLDKYNNDSTGLVSDWMDPDTLQCYAKDAWDWYGWDASRVPWRVAVDYAWNGNILAEQESQTLATFVADEGGPANTCAGYTLDGATCGGPAVTTFAGAFATSAIAQDQRTVNTFFQQLGGVANDGYFNQTLSALYLTTAAGRFNPVCY